MMRFGDVAAGVLEGLYQHRLLSTRQLHDLYTPTTSHRWTRHLMASLQQTGVVDAVRRPDGLKVCFLTPAGLDAVEGAPRTEPRRKLITKDHAAGPLQAHTLAVNDVGTAFVQAARRRAGDEFGALAWRHEIAHPIGPLPGRKRHETLIADALLTYQQTGEDDGAIQFHYRFLELDRATMPTDALAQKLARYARLHQHRLPATTGAVAVRFWETRYPVFPIVLLVLDGTTRTRLQSRRDTVLALCREDPALRQTPEVEITACLLEDLRTHGPFAAIWTTTAGPGAAVDWLANPEPAADR